MKHALLVIDYTENWCLERYERPQWGCTFSAVRAMAPRLSSLVDIYRRSGSGEVIWIVCCPWIKGRVHPNIERLYDLNPDVQFYNDGSGARNFFEVGPTSKELILEKNLYSAFSGTQGRLDAYLKDRLIEKLFISGVYSTGCVNATICEAFHRGYQLSIIRDCVETFDRAESQEYQKALFQDWQYMYGELITSMDLKIS